MTSSQHSIASMRSGCHSLTVSRTRRLKSVLLRLRSRAYKCLSILGPTTGAFASMGRSLVACRDRRAPFVTITRTSAPRSSSPRSQNASRSPNHSRPTSKILGNLISQPEGEYVGLKIHTEVDESLHGTAAEKETRL